MQMKQLHLNDEYETKAFALRLAQIMINQKIRSGRIYLFGNLGAGKTTFSRYLLQGLGVEQTIKSPTYTLIEPYAVAGLAVLHMDFYRISSPLELYDLDFLEEEGSIWLIEWPEKGEGVLPQADLNLYLARRNEILDIRIKPNSEVGLMILEQLIA